MARTYAGYLKKKKTHLKAGLLYTIGSLPIDGVSKNTHFFSSGLLHLTVNTTIVHFVVFLTKHHVLLVNSYIWIFNIDSFLLI